VQQISSFVVIVAVWKWNESKHDVSRSSESNARNSIHSYIPSPIYSNTYTCHIVFISTLSLHDFELFSPLFQAIEQMMAW